MDYTVIRSARKSISLEVKPDLSILVRAPRRMKQEQIEAFVRKHEAWLKGALAKTEQRKAFRDRMETPEQKEALRRLAEEYLPKRTEEWARIMNLFPENVRITEAKTRFGSCSAKNRICYSLWLMAYPKEAVDYVIVHELAHLQEKNHGPGFYRLIARFLPDWKERRALLK